MCGFTGFFGGGDFQREEVIRRMNEQIAHRGPDGEGFFTDENIALGFRRLAIIDPEGGAQPMHSADGRYVIVFNGEIYNYRELRAKLIETHGCNFKTKSDTEVILQLYGIYGVKTASMLRGMFAFVIYDIGQAFIMNNEEANRILAPAYRSSLRYQDVTRPYYECVRDEDELHKKLYLDMHLWLPNDILLKADKMTMAHSLELRVPYLDKKVWELARTLDTSLMTDHKTNKKIFRAAARQVLPTECAFRKKKGFPVPIRLWLRKDKYYRMVKEMFQREFVKEFFNRSVLLQLLEEHKRGIADHQRKIYTVYAFLVWYEQYFLV